MRYQGSAPTTVSLPSGAGVESPPGPAPVGAPIGPVQNGTINIDGEAKPGATIVAANFDAGVVATTTADAAGLFSVTLAVSSGDRLRLYVDADPLSPPWEVNVP